MQKHETRPPTYTICKDKFKMDKRIKCKTHNHKTLKRKHKQ